VPPIAVNSITGANSTITKLADYGGTNSDWSAELGAGSNNMVTITGAFKTPGVGNYNTWSQDGGGSSWGSLVSDSSGTFTLNVLLYAGWNNISLWDPSGNNGYWLNINTNATGKPIINTVVTLTVRAAGAGRSLQRRFATTPRPRRPADSANWQGNDGQRAAMNIRTSRTRPDRPRRSPLPCPWFPRPPAPRATAAT
jgi:hypothetical protein